MALKKPQAPSGAPDWIVTYGDLMSLLLCFFILLAAMANYDKQDKRMMAAIESIREALGSPGQAGMMTAEQLDLNSLMIQLQSIAAKIIQKHNSISDDEGVTGRNARVRRIREGLEVMMGGPIAFDRFSAQLRPDANELVTAIAERIRGHRNKIEIRGHATTEPLPKDSRYADPTDLSYARARTVMDRMVELGIEPERIRVVAVGPFEPLVHKAYTIERQSDNRRVEVIVQQVNVEKFKPEDYWDEGEPTTQPANADPTTTPTR